MNIAVYKYTMKKYIKSFATWLIIGISFGTTFGLIGGLAYGTINYNKIDIASYQIIVNSTLTGMVSVFAFFGTIFAGFQGAKMFKDEVEDGTFLIVISKPQTRIKIIVEKILALFTICLLFIVIVLFSYVLAILVFDKPHTNLSLISSRHNLGKQVGIMFGLALVLLAILSSIALMFSTRFTASATIGLTSAIAIFIPITGFVGTFIKSEPYIRVSNTADKVIPSVSLIVQNEKLFLAEINAKQTGTPLRIEQLQWMNGLIVQKGQNVRDIYSDKNNGLGRIAFTGQGSDKFAVLSFIDLQYQLWQLGKIASKSNAKNTFSPEQLSLIFGPTRDKQKIYLVKKEVNNDYLNGVLDWSSQKMTAYKNSWRHIALLEFNKIITNVPEKEKKVLTTWAVNKIGSLFLNLDLGNFLNLSKIEDYAHDHNIHLPTTPKADPKKTISTEEKIVGLLHAISKDKKLNIIGYKEYVDPYTILFAYIIIALALLPIAYLLIRKQDFR